MIKSRSFFHTITPCNMLFWIKCHHNIDLIIILEQKVLVFSLQALLKTSQIMQKQRSWATGLFFKVNSLFLVVNLYIREIIAEIIAEIITKCIICDGTTCISKIHVTVCVVGFMIYGSVNFRGYFATLHRGIFNQRFGYLLFSNLLI